MPLKRNDSVSAPIDMPNNEPPYPAIYFAADSLRRRWPELIQTPEAPVELGPELGPRLFQNENIWVVTTYLRLKKRGANVKIIDCLQPNAINVVSERQLLRSDPAGRAFVVAAQGDRGKLVWADHTLAQSPVMAKAARTSLIDMWPQPGLLMRDKCRGTEIRRLAYLGYFSNLGEAFRSDRFRTSLRNLGVEFVLREEPNTWHDYSDVDLCLAVRDLPWHWIKTKPSTKLVHAWLTGAVGLLGPEPSYQHWGKDGENYFEVRTPEDVLAVVKRLKDNPLLYSEAQQRGHDMGKAHNEEAVCRQWEHLLWGPIAEQFKKWQSASPATWRHRAVRRRVQWITAPIREKWFYLRARGWRKGLAYGIGRRLGIDYWGSSRS